MSTVTSTATIDTMDALSAKVQHITAALTTMGLQTWIEQSRAGTHPKYFSNHGVSQSYYIHARGAKGEVTLRVSDHNNPRDWDPRLMSPWVTPRPKSTRRLPSF